MQIDAAKRLVARSVKAGRGALSEFDSKRFLSAYGVPITRERLVNSEKDARAAAERLGYPVVLKGCAHDLLHKTEAGLVMVGLGSSKEVANAFRELKARAGSDFGGRFLVQEMVKGDRELMIGMTRDEQFGPSVMFGLGGIFTEILEDVVFRLAPLSLSDAREMMSEIRSAKILNSVRGMARVNQPMLARAIVAVGKAAVDNPDIAEIDINPLIVSGSHPVAVDGLVILKRTKSA
ncbi:MAG: acetate--CoA ligase family protein [Pseudomonadota bacterium]|nr:acetate--CoA ligase family protein [Pseudomonadota bacterium]